MKLYVFVDALERSVLFGIVIANSPEDVDDKIAQLTKEQHPGREIESPEKFLVSEEMLLRDERFGERLLEAEWLLQQQTDWLDFKTTLIQKHQKRADDAEDELRRLRHTFHQLWEAFEAGSPTPEGVNISP